MRDCAPGYLYDLYTAAEFKSALDSRRGADTSAEARYATITKEFMDKTGAWQSNAELCLDSAEVRGLDEAEAAIKTKATPEAAGEAAEVPAAAEAAAAPTEASEEAAAAPAAAAP